MVITDYRVQSILRTYTRQLQRTRMAEKMSSESGDPKQSAEKVSISDEGRRRLMMERLSNKVFEKMYTNSENEAESAEGEGTTMAAAGQERA